MEPVDRKRKIDEVADGDAFENSSKKHLSDVSADSTNDKPQNNESYDSVSHSENVNTPAAQDGIPQKETEPVQPSVTEKVDESSEYSRQEATNIPYDRLIVLEFEATCDDNPNNPASVQVTKVKYFFCTGNGLACLER